MKSCNIVRSFSLPVKLLLLTVLLAMLSPSAAYADDRAYTFQLTVNGETTCRAATGDTVTVTLLLRRTAGEGAMYAVQDEIVFDPAFLAYQPDSLLLRGGVESSVVTLRDGRQAVYMNYVAFDSGTDWEAETVLGSFRLTVLAAEGTSGIYHSGCAVAAQDGMTFYPVTAQDAFVEVSEQCRVIFETNGGSAVPPQLVQRGALLADIPSPTREGYSFAGWYTDIDLTAPWNANAPIDANMTLYAAWQPAASESGSGSALAAAVLLLSAGGFACHRLRKRGRA